VVSPILTTKLFIPPTRSDRLARPRLVGQMEEGFRYPLVVVSASAGSGKTTLLSEWVAASVHPIAWLSLDPEDNDPVQFITYLLHALRTLKDDFGDTALEALKAGGAVPLEEVLIHLINEAAGFSQPFALVLDDYHVITDPRISEQLGFLIEHLPPQMHLVIASRMDPSLPVARYRARSQVFEIRGQDLRFSPEEVTQFLQSIMGLEVSPGDIAALEKRTEGWVAGLQLAALSLQGQDDIPAFIKAFTGSHRYVADYLVEEILNQQPEETQQFLLKTSILERLNTGLCAAVSGMDASQSFLSLLHRKNAFVIPLDSEGQWFRYHHLFADLLQARLSQTLSEQTVSELHKKALDWYRQNHFLVEAVNHALAAKAYEPAAELIEQTARSLIYSGRIKVLRDWLDVLPDNVIQARNPLNFFLFWIDLLQGRADFSEDAIQEKEALIKALPPTPENKQMRGELIAVVCRILALSGRTSQAIQLAQEALLNLSPNDSASRSRVNSALAISLDLQGQAEQAKPVYDKCYLQAAAAGDHLLGIHTIMTRGLVQFRTGHLNQAANTFQAIIDLHSQEDANMLLSTGMLSGKKTKGTIFLPSGPGFIGMGHVLLEQYDLRAAEEYLAKGMDLCRQGGLDGLFIGRLQMSRLYQATRNLDKAMEETYFPKDAFSRADDYNVSTRQIMIELDRGAVYKARQLADPFIKILKGEVVNPRLPLLFYEIVQAVVARVYIAMGETDEALKLLDKLEATAQQGNRPGRLIEVHLLRALAYQKQSEGNLPPKAIENIIRSLEFAAPEKSLLIFIEAGPAVIPLLQAVETNNTVSDEIKKHAKLLLQAFSERIESSEDQPVSSSDALIEPLTPREMEVLALIADGDSNQEIAEKLVITIRTVKKHTSNILGKLNASSRTQAAAFARQLGLLPEEE